MCSLATLLPPVFKTGTPSVESTEGQGTTVKFRVKLTEQTNATMAPRFAPPFSREDTPPRRCLVCDDLKANRIAVRGNLTCAVSMATRATWTFDEASNGEEAIAMARKVKYDVIFIDFYVR